jgi:hypothetical protein
MIKKLNQLCNSFLVAIAVFTSSFANADWYVKDSELIKVANTLATETTIAKVSKAVAAVETEVKNIKTLSLGTGTATDNVNTKLKTINENITELTNQFSFKDRNFPTSPVSSYLDSPSNKSVLVAPKLKCGDLEVVDSSKGNMGNMDTFGSKATAAWNVLKNTGMKFAQSSIVSENAKSIKTLYTACTSINNLVGEMYAEAASFNKQINTLQEKINNYEKIVKPRAAATTDGSSSTSSSDKTTHSYADLAMLSLELQVIQASQANIIGVHASNTAMFKFQIQALKEVYLKLSVKRMLG